MNQEILETAKSASEATCQFVLTVRSFMVDVNVWLLAHHWSVEVYAVIGVSLLIYVCGKWMSHLRAFLKILVSVAVSLVLAAIFAILPVLMLARIIAGSILLLALYRTIFCGKTIPYKRPDLEEEYLGRRLFYRRSVRHIRRMLNRNGQAGGLTMAVYGAWGSGKSHLLRYIERNLCVIEAESDVPNCNGFKGKCSIAKVDLWQSHSLDEAWEQIAEALSGALTGKRSAISHTKLLRGVLSALSALNEHLAPFIYVVRGFMSGGEDYQTKIQSINKLVPQDGAIALFLDNVERCDTEIVMKLLPLLERLKQIEKLVVIVAIAREELVNKFVAVGYEENLLQGVLNKLFDNVMTLPENQPKNLQAMFASMVKQRYGHCLTLMDFARRNKDFVCDTPREVERVVNQLGYIDEQFLARYENLLSDDKWQTRCDCVFNMEVLRLLNDSAYQYLKSKSEMFDFLKKVPRKILDPYCNLFSLRFNHREMELDKQEEEWREKHPDFIGFIEANPEAKAFFFFFSKQSREDYDYALHMDYTSIDVLGDCECEEVINLALDSLMQDSLAVIHAVDALYRDCTENEKKQVLSQSVMYAVKKRKDENACQFVFSAVRDCFNGLQESNLPELYVRVICNVSQNSRWKKCEAELLRQLSDEVITATVRDVFTLLIEDDMKEVKDKDHQTIVECVKNNFHVMEALCRKYASIVLRAIFANGQKIRSHAYSFDFDVRGRGIPYYEDAIKMCLPSITDGMSKDEIFGKILNSMLYSRSYPFSEEERTELLLSGTYFKVVIQIVKLAGVQYEDICSDGKLVSSFAQAIDPFLVKIDDYIKKESKDRDGDIYHASFNAGADSAQKYFSDFLDKIRKGKAESSEAVQSMH